MFEIEPPSFGVGEIVKHVGNAAAVLPLVDNVAVLTAQENAYAAAFAAGSITTFPARYGATTADIETAADSAYASRLRSKAWVTRTFYDVLRMSAPGGTCANCMVRDAAALDHYLPREHYPALAIQPNNLVPICTSCNLTKSSTLALVQDESFLHPYFDRLGAGDWLRAEVVNDLGSPLVFRVERLGHWDTTTFARVVHHVERYGLLRVFSEKSAVLLGNMRVAFESHWTDAAHADRSARISREARRLSDSYAAAASAWQAAAFLAWSESTSFCNGGWKTPIDAPVLKEALTNLRRGPATPPF